MSPDPSSRRLAPQRDPQDWNAYSYVRNNPLLNTDPSGKTTEVYALGPREGNPFGHSSIRVKNSKGDFVYSFDEKKRKKRKKKKGKLIIEKIPFAQYFHDSVRDKNGDAKFQDSGVFDEHPNRMVTGQILTWATDGKQEKSMQAYLDGLVAKQHADGDIGDYNLLTNNCTTQAVLALEAGGLPLAAFNTAEIIPTDLQRLLGFAGAVKSQEFIWNGQKFVQRNQVLVKEEERYLCYMNGGSPESCDW